MSDQNESNEQTVSCEQPVEQASKYKDPNKLFQVKKSVITKQIIQELQEFGGFKFQLALTIKSFKDDVTDVLHGDQLAILTTDKIDEFYNDSSAKIHKQSIRTRD